MRTRFFAVAALVNAVLAKRFEFHPRRPSHSFNFLNEAGAALELDNMVYARQIARTAAPSDLDVLLIHAEQARLQRHVASYEKHRPRQWECARREQNGLLNFSSSISLFSRCHEAGRTISDALHAVRADLGMPLDFAIESHRICVGLGLIKLIRRRPTF